MTVKDIFDLRKQGKIEEAYEAIRPMYAIHQGKYTTLCMFWTASDILKKRIKEQRFDEAEKIFKALQRVLPKVEDSEGRARSSILYSAVTLNKEDSNFKILDFVSQLRVDTLGDNDWKGVDEYSTANRDKGFSVFPSVAQLLLSRAFNEIEQEPNVDNALKVMPLLEESIRRYPNDKSNLHYKNVIYKIMNDAEKAIG